ncbi:hypothetical protein SME05J_02310 [Serratia marcescens]|nr:hypothetical protein SME05J_02310 [Serratia marcescens]
MFSICVPVVMFIIDAYAVGRISGLEEEGERPLHSGKKYVSHGKANAVCMLRRSHTPGMLEAAKSLCLSWLISFFLSGNNDGCWLFCKFLSFIITKMIAYGYLSC